MRDVLETFARQSLEKLGASEASRTASQSAKRIANPEADLRPILGGQDFCNTAVEALLAHPTAGPRYGEHCERLLFRFIGKLLHQLRDLNWDQAVFSSESENFLREIEEPEWHFRALASLQNFESSLPQIDFGNGVIAFRTSHARIREEMAWGDSQIDYWEKFAEPSPCQIIVRHAVGKEPGNFDYMDIATPVDRARIIELALRLFKSGDVRIGGMFYAKRSSYRLGGMARSLRGGWRPGNQYLLNATELPLFDQFLGFVRNWITQRREQLPQIALAQRYFTNTYEREAFHKEDQIVDCFIALEALYLGEEERQELAFSLASRVASLLGGQDEERLHLFERVKTFYRVRSKIVHGSPLRPKHQAELNNVEELRGYVRRSIVAFMKITKIENLPGDFYRRLEKSVLSRTERNELKRRARLPTVGPPIRDEQRPR